MKFFDRRVDLPSRKREKLKELFDLIDKNNHEDIKKLLAEKIIGINDYYEDLSPLHYAVISSYDTNKTDHCNKDTIELLLELDANKSAKTSAYTCKSNYFMNNKGPFTAADIDADLGEVAVMGYWNNDGIPGYNGAYQNLLKTGTCLIL